MTNLRTAFFRHMTMALAAFVAAVVLGAAPAGAVPSAGPWPLAAIAGSSAPVLRVQACPRGYNFNGYVCALNRNDGYDQQYYGGTRCPRGYDAHGGRCYRNGNGDGYAYRPQTYRRYGACPRGYDFDAYSNTCVQN